MPPLLQVSRALAAAVVLASTFAPAHAQSVPGGGGGEQAVQGAGTEEQQLRAAVEQVRQAVLGRDAKTLDRLYASDFTALNADGTVWDKARRLAYLQNQPSSPKALVFSDLQVRMLGTTAVVTGLSQITGGGTTDAGQTRRLRFLQVWMKRGAEWQEVALAVSNVKP